MIYFLRVGHPKHSISGILEEVQKLRRNQSCLTIDAMLKGLNMSPRLLHWPSFITRDVSLTYREGKKYERAHIALLYVFSHTLEISTHFKHIYSLISPPPSLSPSSILYIPSDYMVASWQLWKYQPIECFLFCPIFLD